MRKQFKMTFLAGTACIPLLIGGCASLSPQTTTDINALLGGSAASTMLSYLAGLDPQVSGILTDVDAAIAANAPKVLAVACGGGSAANFVFRTAVTFAPLAKVSIPPDMVSKEQLAFGILSASCPPNPPPANLADAARAAWGAYQQILAGTQGAGVVVPPASAAAAARRR